jgi:hypothetical protein
MQLTACPEPAEGRKPWVGSGKAEKRQRAKQIALSASVAKGEICLRPRGRSSLFFVVSCFSFFQAWKDGVGTLTMASPA